MNNMRSLAKIILSAMGIFFVIRLIPNIIYAISMLIMNPSIESLGISILSVFLSLLCAGVLYYFFFHKREQLAKKIIGKEELPEPDSQISWLPATFRLICVFAGLYCLFYALWQFSLALHQYLLFLDKAGGIASSGRISMFTGSRYHNFATSLLKLVMFVTIGIYLLCGAPHFVRWQVKKTLQQCKDITKN